MLLACLMATFMTAVESTIVATAMPTVVAELGGFDLFAWVFAVYLLTQAVTIPIYGRLADLYGRKPVFYAGCALFLVGSGLCGLASRMAALIAFRTLQGIGAGAIQPVAATILGDIYEPTERGRVQGLVSSVFGISAVLGPSLGAFLISRVGWQAVFWVNIPIGAASVAMLAAFLREDVVRRRHRLDLAGAGLLLAAIGPLIVLLVQGPFLSRPAGIAVAILAAGSFVTLLWHEARTPEPMLPLELWRNRIIVLGSLGNCAAGALMMGVAAFLPAYVQGTMGGTALAGGLVLGAMSVSWALASLASARLMLRTSYRLTAIAGALSLIVGCLILITLTPARGVLWAGLGSFVIGVGMGLGSTVFIVSIQASVPVAATRGGDLVGHVHALRRPVARRGRIGCRAERHDSGARPRRAWRGQSPARTRLAGTSGAGRGGALERAGRRGDRQYVFRRRGLRRGSTRARPPDATRAEPGAARQPGLNHLGCVSKDGKAEGKHVVVWKEQAGNWKLDTEIWNRRGLALLMPRGLNPARHRSVV